jgi:hypothetical protein
MTKLSRVFMYEFPNLIHLAAKSSNSFLASKQINHIFMTRNNKKFDIILLHSPTASFTIPTSPTRARPRRHLGNVPVARPGAEWVERNDRRGFGGTTSTYGIIDSGAKYC